MDVRTATAFTFAGARIAYGAALLARPAQTARAWLGPGADTAPARVGARGLGGRDGLLSAGLAQAVARGHDPRPWLAALALSDLTDIGATLADREGLPPRAGPATVAVAGAFCACGVGLAVAYGSRR